MNLLKPVRWKQKAVNPLMLEVDVPEHTAPYLVSSSKSFVWVERVSVSKRVRAAVRQDTTPAALFQETLTHIIERGRQDKWGNVHPFTERGLLEAIAHVEGYDLGEIELLMNTVPPWADNLKGYIIHKTVWLPENCALVLPVDKEFVGVLVHLNEKKMACVVHNAGRAVGIAIGE